MRIAVTGATGQLGNHVVETLINRGITPADIVAVVRDAQRAAALADRGVQLAVADYDNEQALTEALAGVDRLVLVSASEVGKRTAQHANVINAAKANSVSLIAYTSLINAPTSTLALADEHRVTEQYLADSGIDHAVLRNGWYWENYSGSIEAARASGHLFGAAGDARVSGAARNDYAEAAAIVVTSDDQAGKVYELGGPALSYPEIAAALGTAIGGEVTYVNQGAEELRAGLESAGLPSEVAAFVAGMDVAISQGALYTERADLQQLLGREATPAAVALAG
ncbi:SDR family oxidoreductase [Propionibacteriaceae bacterium Y1923]